MTKLPQEISKGILRLKNYKGNISDIIGLNCIIILSKDIFTENQDIEFYTREVFEKDYLPYLFKSRTLLLARTTRDIYNYDDKEKNILTERIYSFFESDLKDNRKMSGNRKTNNANENMRKWIRALDQND